MYEWDDILIVGDSWCSERDSLDHWPNLLLKELTGVSAGIPRGQGFPGCSWWSIRNKLFDELKINPAKVIIIIHTESTRIPSDDNSPMTVNMAFRTVTVKGRWNTQKKELRARAAAEYYSHLYSANFHMWAERKWFEELDNFLISHENANKFKSTSTNLPWVKNPVCYIDNKRIHVLIDPYDVKNNSGDMVLDVTYIKAPNKFVKGTSLVDFGDTELEINDAMAEELVNLAIIMSTEIVESSRLSTKINTGPLES